MKTEKQLFNTIDFLRGRVEFLEAENRFLKQQIEIEKLMRKTDLILGDTGAKSEFKIIESGKCKIIEVDFTPKKGLY